MWGGGVPSVPHRGSGREPAVPAFGGPGASCLPLPVDPQPRTPIPPSASSSDSRARQPALNSGSAAYKLCDHTRATF